MLVLGRGEKDTHTECCHCVYRIFLGRGETILVIVIAFGEGNWWLAQMEFIVPIYPVCAI